MCYVARPCTTVEMESTSTVSSSSSSSTSKREDNNDPAVPTCELDSKDCLTLANILESFSVVSEEHAFALCYQCAKCAKAVLNDPAQRGQCLLVSETNHLLIHRDGQVHPDTFIAPCDPGNGNRGGKGPPRTKCSCEYKIIANLAEVIFRALDFGLADDEERHLSSDLESLLDAMSIAGESTERPETDDEGIERDSGGDSDDDRNSYRAVNFDGVLQICTRRLGSLGSTNGNHNHHINCNGSSSTSSSGSSSNSSRPQADAHYKAVCRALVAEALELSTFLHKVSQGPELLQSFSSSGLYQSDYGHSLGLLENDPDLRKLNSLNFADWASCWRNVLDQLRRGVELKKVDSPYHACSRGPPVVYELTPYEMLMEDIRSQRYKLNKVMKDGTLPPRIKKDAHDLILDFIRSRPPLRKAQDRILAPATKTFSQREKLMEEIKERPSLKPINIVRKESSRNRSRRINSTEMTESNLNNNKSPSSPAPLQSQPPEQPQRRLIKADLAELYSFDTKDEDDEDNFPEDSPKIYSNGTCFFGHICPDGTQSTPVTPFKKPAEPKFEDNEENNKVDFRRRHTICNPTNREEHGSTLITFPFEYTNSVNVFTSLQCPRSSPILHRRKAKLPNSVSKSSLQEEFFQSNHWQTAIECLSLNLEEVVHIRNVLTKAELESLPVDCSLKEDVEKGKICFLCLKTRFSLFLGPWSNTCKLCKRAVCAKCCSKMRIPTEHFAKVPVSTLSPTISPREEERDLPGSKSLTPTRMDSLTPTHMTRKNSVGSAPTSPNLSRKPGSDSHGHGLIESRNQEQETDYFETSNGPHSLPTVTSISLGLMAFKRRGFGRGKDVDKTEKLKGSLMIVCHDCKAMVLQIIRSSRAKKSGILRNNMTLDLNI